ncbi:MAG: hypothetical protein U0V74_09585 [Chitinophagales bacterium]
MKYALIFFLVLAMVYGNAQQWHELGPCGSDTYGNHVASQGGTGQIHCIAFDPDNPQIVYAGSPFGGLWKSADGANNWSRKNIDTSYALEFASVCDIAITHRNGKKVIWVATGHPGARGPSGPEPYTTGLYYSEDEAQTFKPLTSFNSKFHFGYKYKKHISRIAIHPRNSNIMYVATSDGLYNSNNAGKSWKLVLQEEELPGSYEYTQGIWNVEFSVTNPDKVVYAGGRDVYRSTKGGKRGSFKSLTHSTADLFAEPDCFKNLNFSLDVNTADGRVDVLYALAYFVGDTCGEFRGKQGMTLFYFDGQKWERKNFTEFGLPDAIRIKLASVSGKPSIIYAGAVTSSVSSDGGKSWSKCTDYNQPGHADIHAIEIVPNSNNMIIGTDGGIFIYNYAAKKVEERNSGLCLAQIMDMATAPTNAGKILVGMQDVGSAMLYEDKWSKLPFGGDGYPGQYIDETDEWNIYTSNNSSYTNTHSGKDVKWKSYYLCNNALGQFPNNLKQRPGRPQTIYYTGQDVYRSDKYGMDNSWCRISDFTKYPGVYINPFGHIISGLAICDSFPDVMYASFNANALCCNPLLFKTETGGLSCDGGQCHAPGTVGSWQLLSVPRITTGSDKDDFIENSYYSITSVEVNNANPDEVWLSYSFYDLNRPDFKVFHSTDGGQTWKADDKGLPDYPCMKILYVKGDGGLFVSTLNGIYYKKGNADWKKYGEGLPHITVTDMEINYASRKLRAATFGAGVWEIELP